MNAKKLIVISAIIIILLMTALLVIINTNFFKELTHVSSAPKEELAVEAGPELNYAIPSTGSINQITTIEIAKRRNTTLEKELKAERARSKRRAAALEQLKQSERALLNTAPIDPTQTEAVLPPDEDKEDKLPTDKKIKEMEAMGIFSH